MFELVTPDRLYAFLLAGILLNLTPGADVMFAIASGLSGGARAGMAAGLGVGFGSLFHCSLAVVGVSALIAAVPAALTALKWAGAAYLVWLAVQSWRATGLSDAGGSLTPRAAIRRGFVTNVLNPKVALFVLAFLPQFADPKAGPMWEQLLTLGLIFTVTGTIVTMTYGALAGTARQALARHASLLNKISGTLLGYLAWRFVRD